MALPLRGETALFPPIKRRMSQRTARRVASNVTKLLKSTVKFNETAARQGSKAVRQARKAVKTLQDEQTSKPPGRFVEVDGLRVHYIARGRGRPVVLIHGNGTMAEDFVICGSSTNSPSATGSSPSIGLGSATPSGRATASGQPRLRRASFVVCWNA